MKKYLIGAGCSMTCNNYYSNPNSTGNYAVRQTWPSWPENLAKKYDLTPVNIGVSGYCNQHIARDIMKKILQLGPENIAVVFAGWTEINRRPNTRFYYNETRSNLYERNHTFIDRDGDFELKDSRVDDLYALYSNTLDTQLHLQYFCERHRVRLCNFHMLHPWIRVIRNIINCTKENKLSKRSLSYGITEEKIKLVYEQHAFKNLIDVKKWIGWPGFEDAGYAVEDKVLGTMFSPYRISPDDMHPNADGHELIARYLYDNWV